MSLWLLPLVIVIPIIMVGSIQNLQAQKLSATRFVSKTDEYEHIISINNYNNNNNKVYLIKRFY